MKKIKVLGLIPSRLGSQRLPQKALLPIKDLPLVIHTYRRAKLSKKLDDVYICCDDNKIMNISKKFNAKSILTSKKNENGTERIYEAYKKIKKKYDLIIDIQGDEPLISPIHIDKVISFHKKNLEHDIVLPTLKIKSLVNQNIIKVITNQKNDVLYLSRAQIPFEYNETNKYSKKHLSIISFKPNALKKFALNKKTPLEKIEDVELLRALEIGIRIKSIELKGDSFSVDVKSDYVKAKKKMPKDKYFKLYNKN